MRVACRQRRKSVTATAMVSAIANALPPMSMTSAATFCSLSRRALAGALWMPQSQPARNSEMPSGMAMTAA